MIEKTNAKSAAAPKGGTLKAAAATVGRARTKAASRGAGRQPAAPAWSGEDLYERIQRRAYELWEREGRPHGRAHVHWQQAELEITRAHTRAAA